MYQLRAFGLYSIVLAHSCYPSIKSSIDYYFFSRLSCVGVVIFLFVSGYYLKNESMNVLFPKLIKKIFFPWLFCGSLVYMIGIVKGGNTVSVKSYINYMIGNGSYLYYCTIYIVLRVLLSILPLKKQSMRRMIAFGLVGLNVISLLLKACGILPNYVSDEKWFFEYLSPYLNIFNWVGFLAVGILIKEFRMLDKIGSINQKTKSLCMIIATIVFFVGIRDVSFGYFGLLSFFCEISIVSIFIIVLLSTKKSVLTPLAMNSFPIYLIHYPVLSLLCHNPVLKESTFVAMVRPVLCILFVAIILKAGEIISKAIKIEKVYYVLTGTNPQSLFPTFRNTMTRKAR